MPEILPGLPAHDLSLSLLALAALCLAYASYTDVKRTEIPDSCSIALAVLFALFAAISGLDIWWQHLLLAMAMFIIGAVLFYLHVWGGGDAKLLAGIGLFAGPTYVLQLLLIMALAGGMISIFMLIRQRLNKKLSVSAPHLPYGVAISAGGWWVLYLLAH